MYRAIETCRICGNPELDPVLDLGEQCLTGVFPRRRDERVTAGPLELVKCREDAGTDACGLLQLRHTYDLAELYGLNYGYRSGLNAAMVRHLHAKVKDILALVPLAAGDLVIDIGSNDGTLLSAYPEDGPTLVGIDPTGVKFESYYPRHVRLVPDFFSARAVAEAFPGRRAKVVTSIAMFYDLDDPMDFMRQVRDVLADDGVWVFEQSYMPTMLRRTAYDTVCHEHLEYYRLKQIAWMAERVGLRLLDCRFNDVNGGSFSVVAARSEAPYPAADETIAEVLAEEERAGLATPAPYRAFRDRVRDHREALRRKVAEINAAGGKVYAYGASTKGNVVLQFCGFTASDIACVAEVNEDKFGRYTPGTGIPIVPETEARAGRPDYLMVMPWHFRDGIVAKERNYLEAGGKLLFPLPRIEIVGG